MDYLWGRIDVVYVCGICGGICGAIHNVFKERIQVPGFPRLRLLWQWTF